MPVFGIAAKQLIAAVAGEGNGDMPPGRFRDEKGGKLRRVGERFVEPVGNTRDKVERGAGFERDPGVIGTEMLRDRLRVRGLVERRVVEADGEGFDGSR